MVEMFDRFDATLNTASGQAAINDFKNDIEFLRGLPMNKMVAGVNDIVNRVPYINDSEIYGKSDHWATPIEFMKNGGDCERFCDYKIRGSSTPLAFLKTACAFWSCRTCKRTLHAILIVYTDNGPVLLDNQIKTVTHVRRVSHYKPIFSINREGWWLHTKPKGNVTVVASSSR